MGFGYLTESSTLGLSENIHISPEDSSIEIKPLISEKNFQNPAKFHIGMLSVSLVAGLTYSVFVTYNCWREKNVLLSHIRNLVIALTCKIFFSILFDSVIILESLPDVHGGNTLLSFECISQNLVVAFWLTLTIYIHARVQRNFNSEPSLKLYIFGVPGVAVYFAMIQIFAMEGTHSSQGWWMFYYVLCVYQWVVNSIRLLYLLIQLGLLIDIGRMMVIKSFDNDTVSLIRKIAILMATLVLLFWLQFGLSVGRPPQNNPQPYLYFYHLIDGTMGVLVCLVLFFFNKWVPMILDKLPNITMESGKMAKRISRSNDEVLIRGDDDKGIVTIDSLLTKQESGRWRNMISDGPEDVVYSSVVQPQNLQKTIDLYKRLNIIPADNVTIIEGEEFYDCGLGNDFKRSESLLFQQIRSLEPDKSPKPENKVSEKVVKKNAFYSSKYLIVDPKEKDIPRYLETRPCTFPAGKEASKEELRSKPSKNLETLGADELVKKWLTDHSGDMEKARKNRNSFEQASIEKQIVEEEDVRQNAAKSQEQRRPNESENAFCPVDSSSSGTLSAPMREESVVVKPDIQNGNNSPDRSLQNSDISEVRSEKKSRLDQSGINASNDQLQTVRNFKVEVLDLRVGEKQISEGDNEKTVEENEKATPQAAQDFRQTGNVQHSEQKEIIKQIYEIQDDEKGGKREISEDPKTDIMCTSKSECESNLSKSALEPPQKEKIQIPTNDFDPRVTIKDEAEVPKSRLETETDTEKSPETFMESYPLDNRKGSNLKQPQGLPSSKENFENSEANDLTYSELLAFRFRRDELEKENLGGTGSGLGLTSAIFSAIGAAINYGGNFFRPKSEDTQSK